MKSSMAIDHWLETHPDWILGSELKTKLADKAEYRKVLEKTEFGFITFDGVYYSRLREIPTFVGVRHVVKAKKHMACMS